MKKYRILKFYNSSRGRYNYYLQKKVFGLFWWDPHYGYDGYERRHAESWAKHYKINIPQ